MFLSLQVSVWMIGGLISGISGILLGPAMVAPVPTPAHTELLEEGSCRYTCTGWPFAQCEVPFFHLVFYPVQTETLNNNVAGEADPGQRVLAEGLLPQPVLLRGGRGEGEVQQLPAVRGHPAGLPGAAHPPVGLASQRQLKLLMIL